MPLLKTKNYKRETNVLMNLCLSYEKVGILQRKFLMQSTAKNQQPEATLMNPHVTYEDIEYTASKDI